MNLICTLFDLYLVAVFARIIMSWFPISPGTVMAQIYEFLFAITEPVLGPVRRMMPGVGSGGFALDLSPIVVIIGLQLVGAAIGC